MKALLTYISLTLLLLTPAAHAQDMKSSGISDASCAALNTALPPLWAAWRQTEATMASTTASSASVITAGKAYAIKLSPATQVTLAVPGRPPKAGTFAGLLGFDVATAGVYTIALDQPAWIDMVDGEHALRSIGHASAIPCTNIRKTVDFQLEPGHYTLQLTNAPQTALTVEIQPRLDRHSGIPSLPYV